jgi:hypothetical protein
MFQNEHDEQICAFLIWRSLFFFLISLVAPNLSCFCNVCLVPRLVLYIILYLFFLISLVAPNLSCFCNVCLVPRLVLYIILYLFFIISNVCYLFVYYFDVLGVFSVSPLFVKVVSFS